MARLNSFYLAPDDWPDYAGDITRLDGAEARHMLTVLRTRQDQTVRLFDGNGRDGLFQLVEAKRNHALLKTISIDQHERPDIGLTLAIGWGKSKRRNYLFEKTVELCGDGVAFWQAERSQGNVPDMVKETWQDKCIQAAKQCGSSFLPELNTLSRGIDDLAEYGQTFDQRFIAWEAGEMEKSLTPAHLSSGRSLMVIGPEGGFEPAEVDKLVSEGFITVSLGHSILRWETAATYCLSLSYFAGQIA